MSATLDDLEYLDPSQAQPEVKFNGNVDTIKAWGTTVGGGGGGGGSTSPLTTKGDLYGFGTAAARIAVGTDGQVLTADSTQADGLTWTTPSGGGSSTPGDPDFASVVLLTHLDGASGATAFTDSSSAAHAMTAVGGAVVTAANPLFGNNSYQGNGSNSLVTTPIAPGSDLDLSAGGAPWTVEGWIRSTSLANELFVLLGTYGSSGFYLQTTGGGTVQGAHYLTSSGGSMGGGTIAAGAWTHVAVVFSGSGINLYTGGVSSGPSGVSGTAVAWNGLVNLGGGGGSFYSGQMAEWRVTKGIARYSANFTPPTAPFLLGAAGGGGGGAPGGADTQIQFNAGGAFAGSANLAWDDVAQKFTVLGTANAVGARLVSGSGNSPKHRIESGDGTHTDLRQVDGGGAFNIDLASGQALFSLSITGSSILDVSTTYHTTQGIWNDQSFNVANPSDGQTVSIGFNNGVMLIEPSAALAALTVNLPHTSIKSGARIRFSSTQDIAALTVTASGGDAVNNAPASLTAGQGVEYLYRANNTTWYRIL